MVVVFLGLVVNLCSSIHSSVNFIISFFFVVEYVLSCI